MTKLIQNQPRSLATRIVEQPETLQTLNNWKMVFKNFYRRCPFYGHFLQPGITWTNELNKGFVNNEPTGLKRSPEVLAADWIGFLICVGSYLPFDYLSKKLVELIQVLPIILTMLVWLNSRRRPLGWLLKTTPANYYSYCGRGHFTCHWWKHNCWTPGFDRSSLAV